MNYNEAEGLFKRLKKYLKRRVGLSVTPAPNHSERRQEFSKLPSHEKNALISPQLEIFVSAVSRKYEILPVIATLAAALIVVATLNDSLVALRISETKTILSILLILIPVTLHFSIKNNEKTALNAIEVIKSYQSEGIFNALERTTFLRQATADFPIIVVYILYGAIALVIFRTWFG